VGEEKNVCKKVNTRRYINMIKKKQLVVVQTEQTKLVCTLGITAQNELLWPSRMSR